jgi:hypothetical protein
MEQADRRQADACFAPSGGTPLLSHARVRSFPFANQARFLEHSFEVLVRRPSQEDGLLLPTPSDLTPPAPCETTQDQLVFFSSFSQTPSLSHEDDLDSGPSYDDPSYDDNGQIISLSQSSDPTTDQKSFEAWLWNLEQVPKTIVMAPDYEAVTFFFKNFITLPQQAESTRGYLEFLVPLYNLAMPSSALHLITSAVAMATCGQYPGKQMLLREAVSTYGKAIRKVNHDLQDLAASKADETVLAILMFALYEVSVHRTHASSKLKS